MGFNSPNKEEANVEEFFPAERQQRLDLILHLIPNTKQVVLLRGPEQSGKSFFIKRFKKQIDESWQFCLVPAEDLMQTTTPLQVLTDAFNELEGNNKQLLVRLVAGSKAEKKIIICIEDTHKLDVARFDFLFQLADSYSCLQLLLTSSDNLGEAVEYRCQLMDLEPFTQQQTTEYARRKIHKNSLGLTNLAGLDDVVLFIETGGLPGRINDVLEQLDDSAVKDERLQSVNRLPLIRLIGVAALVTVVLLFSLYLRTGDEVVTSTVLQGEQLVEKKTQMLESPQTITDAVEQPIIKKIESAKKIISLKQSSTSEVLLSDKVETKVMDGLKKPKEEAVTVKLENKVNPQKTDIDIIKIEAANGAKKLATAIKESDSKKPKVSKELTGIQLNHLWVENRDKNHFTLQLLGVSTEESARNFLLKHKVVKPLYFFQNKRNGGKWFSVIYGDFESKEVAYEKAKKLPLSLAKLKPWVRQFEAIQGDVFVKK